MGRKNRVKQAAGIMVAALLLTGAAGCSMGNGLSKSTENLTAGRVETTGQENPSAVDEEFAKSYTDFSIRLLRESKKQQDESGREENRIGKNSMVSPLSVMLALEMTRSGAGGETKEEMGNVLYPGLLPEQGKEGLLACRNGLQDGAEYRLHIADSIWYHTGEDKFTPNEEFLGNAAETYQAQIYGAPFDQTTLSDINQWVKNETGGMVPEILDEIPEDAILYLVNAAAFEAEWEEVYDAGQIGESDFVNADGSTGKIEMMYSEESYFLEGEQETGFMKPYAGGYRFVAILPEEGMSLDTYLTQLDGAEFRELMHEAKETETFVLAGIPKFEADASFELKDVLEMMGMSLAFDPERADFTEMGSCPAGNLFINRVLHRTYINVDELGTKAGAATVVEAMAEGAELHEETVYLDRPFLYAIVDEKNELPVFLGTVEYLGS